MRSLRSFLLEEALLREGKFKAPEGYQEISAAGGITNQLKELLQIDSAKDLNLKSNKPAENQKVSSKEGKASIVKDLGLSGGDFKSILKSVAKSSKMDGVFTGIIEDYDGSEPGLKMQLDNGWEQIAGKRQSTLKFIRYWCTCACIAAGISNAASVLEFLVSDSGKVLLVVEK